MKLLLLILLAFPAVAQVNPGDLRETIPLLSRPPLPRGGLAAGWDLRTVNLQAQSAAIGTSPWVLSRMTAPATGLAAFDGSLSATRLRETAETNTHNVGQGFTPYTVGSWSFAADIKADGRTKAALRELTSAQGIGINLETGELFTQGGAPAATSVTALGGGWYRVSMSITLANTSGRTFAIYTADAAGDLNYAGDANLGILVARAQLNQGTTPLSYTATGDLQSVANMVPGGAALQRGSTSGADTNDPTPTLAGWSLNTDDYGLVSQKLIGDLTNSTVVIVAKQDTETTASYLYGEGSTSSAVPIWGLSTGSSNAKHSAWIYRGDDNNSDSVSLGQEVFTAGAWRSHAVVKSGTSMLRYWDGGNAVSATVSNRTLTLNRVTIGARSLNTPSNFFNGTISFVLVWNRALNPGEIARVHRWLRAQMNQVSVVLP